MGDDEFKRRLESSLSEFDYAVNSDQFIYLINDNLNDSVSELKTILEKNLADDKKQIEGRNLAIKLKKEVKNLLSTLD
jgi:guanylate kinase